MRTINIKAASDNTGKVTDFINEQLEEYGITTQNIINIVLQNNN